MSYVNTGNDPQPDDKIWEDPEEGWRRLALQFDGHRMQAIGHLKCLLKDPAAHSGQAVAFLAQGPLSGDKVLAQRIREILTTTTLNRRCKTCRSPRSSDVCHKCGSPTFVPHRDWDEPAVPPIDRIRELAREVGYAIAVHGTLERDLDLIAAPWTEDACGRNELFQHIATGLGARIIEIERKPLGRYAATIQMHGWFKNIDLSVCTRGD